MHNDQTKTSRKRPSNRIQLSDLRSYVQKKTNREEIFVEFASLKDGYYTYNEVALQPENMRKNRYDTLFAYDNNRVRLEMVDDDQTSDYINANYIDGYNKPRKFIAAQGPLPGTVDDFWRMVWQEKVQKIVMVTGVIERRTRKCEQYWPDTSATYGSIAVQLQDTKEYSEYVVRTLQISKGGTSRVLTQFHFTNWLDQCVPENHKALAQFITAVREFKTDVVPVVVHCSAGVARTGVMILLDSMIEMARAEKAVDLLSYLWAMRKQRYNAISAAEQYLFTYQMLADHLLKEEDETMQEKEEVAVKGVD